MSCARRRLRCVRRTGGSCLDAKRVGVEAGNQYYNTRGRTRIVEGGEDTETKTWHEGVGISHGADRKHAEAIIRETGASNLASLKIPMSKESKEEVRDKSSGEEKVAKAGHEGTTVDRTDFEPCRNYSV